MMSLHNPLEEYESFSEQPFVEPDTSPQKLAKRKAIRKKLIERLEANSLKHAQEEIEDEFDWTLYEEDETRSNQE